MKSHETNRVVAELLGWTAIEDNKALMLGVPVWIGYPPTGAVIGRKREIPRYTNSRDACSEFESTITSTADRVKWLNTMREIVSRRCPKNKIGAPLVSDFDIAMSTAMERCECWLKMNGRWE